MSMPAGATRFRWLLFRALHPRAAAGWPECTSDRLLAAVAEEFREMTDVFDLDAEAFRRFKRECGYAERYVGYMGPELLDQKLLEHYVSLELLRPVRGETLIDVGGAESPFAEYVEHRFGARGFSLDMAYPPGIHGRRIGCGADAIPLEDRSVDLMTLHCAIDHFEGERDTRFVREAARILRPGGRVCILPVYFASAPTNVCNPRRYSPGQKFDSDAEVRAVAGYENRFGRFYGLETFRRRILDASPALRPRLYRIGGDQPRIPNNYLHHALVLRREDAEEPR
jgi:hypothetical protein